MLMLLLLAQALVLGPISCCAPRPSFLGPSSEESRRGSAPPHRRSRLRSWDAIQLRSRWMAQDGGAPSSAPQAAVGSSSEHSVAASAGYYSLCCCCCYCSRALEACPSLRGWDYCSHSSSSDAAAAAAAAERCSEGCC